MHALIKWFLIFVVLIYSGTTFAQSWKDSVELAIQAYKNQEFKKAQQLFMSAQRIAPPEVDLSKSIGTTSYRAGDFATAKQAFGQINTNEKDLKQINYHNLGNTAFQEGDYKEAVNYYKEALRTNFDPKSQHNLAIAQRRLNQKQNESSPDSQNDKSEEESEDNQSDSNRQSEQSEQNNNDNAENNSSNTGNDNQPTSEEEAQLEEQLSNKRIERILEELSKKEFETQQRLLENQQRRQQSTNSSSRKNW